jgi:hypothetical protein
MVKKIVEMTPDELSRAMNYMAGQPGPMPEYNELGVRFTAEHLEKLKCTLIFFPLENMAQYAHRDVREAFRKKDISEIRQQLELIDWGNLPPFELFTPILIGNLAFITLWCEEENLREISKTLLNKIYDWHWEMILTKYN